MDLILKALKKHGKKHNYTVSQVYTWPTDRHDLMPTLQYEKIINLLNSNLHRFKICIYCPTLNKIKYKSGNKTIYVSTSDPKFFSIIERRAKRSIRNFRKHYSVLKDVL